MGFLKMIGLVVVVLVLGFWLPFLFRVLPWWCRDIYKYFKYPRKIQFVWYMAVLWIVRTRKNYGIDGIFNTYAEKIW